MVFTEIWTMGSDLPENYLSLQYYFSPYYTGNNKIILFNKFDVTRHIWLYYIEENVWKRCMFSSEEDELFNKSTDYESDDENDDFKSLRAILMQFNASVPSFTCK